MPVRKDKEDEDPPEERRSRREKASRANNSLSKFELLKQARAEGKKIKAEIPKDDLYEYIPEEEYERKVMERQREFVVNDGSASAVEYQDHGQEIFEEIETEKEAERNRGKKRKPVEDKPEGPKARQISDYFASGSGSDSKRKKKDEDSPTEEKPKSRFAPKDVSDEEYDQDESSNHSEASSIEPVGKQTPQNDAWVKSLPKLRMPFGFSAIKPPKPTQNIVAFPLSVANTLPSTSNRTRSVSPPLDVDELPDTLPDLEPVASTSRGSPELPFGNVSREIDATSSQKENSREQAKEEAKRLAEEGKKKVEEAKNKFKARKEVKFEPAIAKKAKMDLDPMDDDDKLMAAIDIEETMSAAKETAAKNGQNLPDFGGLTQQFDHLNSSGFVDDDDSVFEGIGVFPENSSELNMFYLDAYEDQRAQPGSVFLFGKTPEPSTKRCVSVCLKVNGIERRQFLLMRDKKVDPKTGEETDEPVTHDDVRTELEEKLKHRLKLTTGHSLRTREVTKKYAFEKLDVPAEGRYVEVRYPFACNPIPENFEGETFSTVFGRNTSALEIFLIDRKLRGPSWITVQKAIPSPKENKFSWCNMEFTVEKPADVSLLTGQDGKKAPPVVTMSVQLRTVVNAKTKQNEVTVITAWLDSFYNLNQKCEPRRPVKFIGVSAPNGMKLPNGLKDKSKDLGKVEIATAERTLLSSFLAFIATHDPDFIIFHEAAHPLDILVDRLTKLNVQFWSRIGRLKRSSVPQGKHGSVLACAGRIICDVSMSARELVRPKSLDLTTLQTVLLPTAPERHELVEDSIPSFFWSVEGLVWLLQHTLCDAVYCMQLMAEMCALPLMLKITQIVGNLFCRTMLGGSAERVEHLLLHRFTENNYICPDRSFQPKNPGKENKAPNKKGAAASKKAKKQPGPTKDDEEEPEETSEDAAFADDQPEVLEDADEVNEVATAATEKKGGKRKPAFGGGKVLEPKRGLYDTPVILMDFNSLYPSIIREYNICFTTVDRQFYTSYNDEELDKMLPEKDTEQGILPKIIENLLTHRKNAKDNMDKSTGDEKMRWNITQKAYKLIANSLYGYLGQQASRFRAIHIASLITAKGRELLTASQMKIEKMGLGTIIYGDTDSLMINVPEKDLEKALSIGLKIKADVSRPYRHLELGVDGIFRSMLLLNKKKYAASKADLPLKKIGEMEWKESTEIKGLDVVRRDWSVIASETGKAVIKEILAVGKQSKEETIANIQQKLQEVAATVRDGRCPVSDLTIIKQLTKDPSLYADAKSNPHVLITRRLNAQPNRSKKFKAGDMIPYVICNEVPEGATVNLNQRVPHTQRAYHAVEEFTNSNGQLTVDVQYYLAEQIHRVVNRQCEPIEGLDSPLIAEFLGIDRNQFPQFYSMPAADVEEEEVVPDEELYKNCLPLTIACPQCKENWEFRDPICEKDSRFFFILDHCPSCTSRPIDHLVLIENKLQLAMVSAINSYYKVKLTCQNNDCYFKCSFIPPAFRHGEPVCPRCEKSVMKPEFSDRDLYQQLCFYKLAFEPERALEKIKKKPNFGELAASFQANPELDGAYKYMAEMVQSVLDKNDYGMVRFGEFFLGGR